MRLCRSVSVVTRRHAHANRGRLIHELRYYAPSPTIHFYEYRYKYDQGGNRTNKFDDTTLSDLKEWRYTYDLDAPGTYQTANNRLMKVVEYTGQGMLAIASKTTFYVYNCGGNVTRIVSRDEEGGVMNMAAGGGPGAPGSEPLGFGGGETMGFRGGLGCGFGSEAKKYKATRFEYGMNGRPVTFARGAK